MAEGDPWGPWDPASLGEVAELFGESGAKWWIAGGWAIELAVGRALRSHDDIDVLLLRRDQFAIQRVLKGWDWHAADPPGTLRPWPEGEWLPLAVHDIWCRPTPDAPWRIQFMLDESSGDDWVSRRDSRIRRPIGEIGYVSAENVPYLVPEIQLLYKANGRRPKDDGDFAATLPVLGNGQRAWLRDALTLAYGPAHPWLSPL
jgi:hypothetical protein